MRTYLRDSRSPVPKSPNTSKVMSRNKAKNSKPELLLRAALWRAGIKGYRLHWKSVPGRPDIAFVRRRVAVFVNGCYWHRCPHCALPLPKHNSSFWQNKFQKNIERDIKKINNLESMNWMVVTFWECELKKDIGECVEKIKRVLGK